LIYLINTLLFLNIYISVFPQENQANDSILYVKRTFSGEEIARGERLFYGLAYPSNKQVNCSGCHNTRVSDTLNWNPDAFAISVLYKDKSAADLRNVLLSPSGKKMTEVHKDFQLTPEDIVLIKAYMDKFTTIGLNPGKPVITNLLLFVVAFILFLLFLTDLVITKKIKIFLIHITVLSITGVYIVSVLAVNAIRLGRSQNYSPDQPIKFSHAIHAGQNQTDCLYCHSYAETSKTPGIPATSICMNCHIIVRNGTRSGTFEIAKIINSHDNDTPIKWIKVHNLPDFVFFSHAQHVSIGKIDCAECHGDVKKMDIIVQVSDLSMGWCVECHRTRKVNFQTNNFFTEYKDMMEKVRSGRADTVTAEMLGATDCMKCHY
jgi:hypothetical protein